jgi:hypothetical protein
MTYKRTTIDSKIIDVAHCKTCKKRLLTAQCIILTTYYHQRATTRAFYESTDGPAQGRWIPRFLLNCICIDDSGVFTTWAVNLATIQFWLGPDPEVTVRNCSSHWLRSAKKWRLPTCGQERPWRPWPTEMRNRQIPSQRKQKWKDKSPVPRMSMTSTLNYTWWGKDTSLSPSMQLNKPYSHGQMGMPQAWTYWHLEPYTYSCSERGRELWNHQRQLLEQAGTQPCGSRLEWL